MSEKSKKKEFKMDNVPDWLRIAADPKSEEDHRLVTFLGTYGLDSQSSAICMNDSINLLFMLFDGEMQAFVDYEMKLESKQKVCKLLHSWGIPCTLERLEIRASAVVKCFVPQYVTLDQDMSR